MSSIRVDLAGHRVVRDGRIVYLRRQEVLLLLELIRHAGRVLTRDHLRSAVWQNAPGVTSRTVDTHVYMLRQKLEADPARPTLIVTITRVGYMLDAMHELGRELVTTPDAARGRRGASRASTHTHRHR